METFYNDVANGTLPAYALVEPRIGPTSDASYN